MLKSILFAVAAFLVAISLYMAFKRFKKTAYPQMPRQMLTVAAFKYNAYTSAMEGQGCTVKGICTKKFNNMATAALYIADRYRDTFGTPLRCFLNADALSVSETIEPGTELVVTGVIEFSNTDIVLKQVKIISIQNATSAP